MLKKTVILMLVLFVAGCNSSQDSKSTKKIIGSTDAPKAIGPYSQAVMAGNTLYCSGQIAIDPKTGKLKLSRKVLIQRPERKDHENK